MLSFWVIVTQVTYHFRLFASSPHRFIIADGSTPFTIKRKIAKPLKMMFDACPELV
jgi:hypothetical protein